MAPYKLIYFQLRGRAESIRLLLEDNGISYEDVICGGESWVSHWKPQMQFGQVPCLKDNDLQIVQSNAILRYLGRKHDLYGSNIEEAAEIDMINDSIEDCRVKYAFMIYRNYENGKDQYISDIPSVLKPFEKLLSKNGADKSGCCVGNKKSFTDYNLIDVLDIHLLLTDKLLDDFPVLSAYYKQNMSRPGIAKYHDSDVFKQRNVNGNGKQ